MRLFPAILAAILAASCLGSRVAEAQSEPTRRIELRHDLVLDATITGVMVGGLVTWLVVKSDVVGTRTCTICDGRAPGEVNGLDNAFRSLRHDDITPARVASDIGAYALAPSLAVSFTLITAYRDDRLDEAPLNGLLALEAILTATVVQQGLTALVRRERPFVHERPVEERDRGFRGSPLESFPGGHTMLVMAATASTATIAALRRYRLVPVIWVAGSLLAVAVSYLRIAGDQHYFTDNLLGGAIGLGVGAGVPLLFHGRAKGPWYRPAAFGTRPVPDGRVVEVTWPF